MILKYENLIKCILLFICFVVATIFIKIYFKPTIGILALILVCKPLSNFLERKGQFTRRMSALFAIMFVNLAVITGVAIIAVVVFEAIVGLVIEGFDSIKLYYEYIISEISLIPQISEGVLELINSVPKIGKDLLSSGTKYTADAIVLYIISNIITYFILADREKIIDLLERLILKHNVDSLKEKYYYINKYIKATVIIVGISTVQTIIGLGVLGVDQFLSLGLVSGLFDILPYIGRGVVFIPLLIINIIEGKYIIVIGLGALVLIGIITRNVLEIKYMSKELELHPAAMLIGMYIGMKMFGIIGMMIAPIYIISAKDILYPKRYEYRELG